MLPNPLHPAVVHFPMVLVVLLPIFAAGALWVIRRGSHARRSWAIPLLLSAALAGSAYLALQTGGAEEERVEAVVSEAALHEHEEAAGGDLVYKQNAGSAYAEFSQRPPAPAEIDDD